MNKRTGNMLVVGAGASGRAAARLLTQTGWAVTLADRAAPEGAWPDLPGVLARREVEGLRAAEFDGAIVSPGFAVRHPWLEYLRAQDIPMVPEFEWGARHYPDSRIIAVTGTNGKSSLVKWVADTLVRAGYHAEPCGNYGVPPCALAAEGRELDVLVLELSSFQLEQAVSFRPDIGILLNLTPNHLDRHADFDEYVRAKSRLFAGMEDASSMIIHALAWPLVARWLPGIQNPRLFGEGGACEIVFRDGVIHRSGREPVDLRGTMWGVRPWGVNAAAGVAALDAMEIPAETTQAAAAAFSGLPHRLEELPPWRGMRFINDSKASTLAAMAAAVASSPRKKHLIAGGILKESDLSFVKELLAKNCAFVYCIGTVAQKLVQAWGDVVPCLDCGDMATAVQAAMSRMKRDEVLLLSPGCSSFDQFASYGERGNVFKNLVQEFIGKNQNEESYTQGVPL